MRARKPSRVPLDLHGLGGREGLFRFPTAAKRDRAVDAWLGEGSDALRAIARRWFAQMRECGDDVRELLHDGHPTACVGDAAFGYVDTFKDHINVGFFRGADLPDAHGLLEGTGKSMRHVKIRPGAAFDEASLIEIIIAAHADMQRRVGTK